MDHASLSAEAGQPAVERFSAYEELTADQLLAERDRLVALLPSDVIAAFADVINTNFDCGQHDREDDEPYEAVYRRSLEAEAQFVTAVLTAIGAPR